MLLIYSLWRHLYPCLYKVIPSQYWNWKTKKYMADSLELDTSLYQDYLKGKDRILDIGCGYGRMFPLYKEIPEVYGFDLLPLAIRIVKAKYPNYNLKVMRAQSMDYPEDFFDGCISNNTLSYVPPKYIGESIRRIKTQCRSILLVERAKNPNFEHYVHDYVTLFKDWRISLNRNYEENYSVLILYCSPPHISN